MKTTKPNRIIGLDNFERNPQEEQQINTLFESVFKREDAQAILSYLRQITIESVSQEISDASRHLEGQRYIVGPMQRRFNKGEVNV